MLRLVVSSLCFALSACSALVDDACPLTPGVTLECVDGGCPQESEVACISEHFGALFSGWDAREPLRATWQDVRDGSGGEVYSAELSAWHVVAHTRPLLLHELLHAWYERTTGDPNRKHTGEWLDREVLAQLALNGCGP